MIKIISILMLSLIVCFSSFAEKITCKAPLETDVIKFSPRLTYEVAGTEKLYLYAVPNKNCIDKNIFVIPGDSLIAYGEFGEWSQVVFFSKNGKSTDGWVITKRLKFIGASGMEMTPEEFKFYTEASKAAKAGRLGSPWEKN